MDDFLEAQRLFGEYEKDGNVASCQEAVDILDELIEAEGPDTQRATNLKRRITDRVGRELKEIFERNNVKEFIRDPVGDKFYQSLFRILPEEDAQKVIQLFRLMGLPV